MEKKKLKIIIATAFLEGVNHKTVADKIKTKPMTHKEAKEILERYNYQRKKDWEFTAPNVTEALDIAIQCLEDSIEVKEANEKLKDLPRNYKDVLCSCDNPKGIEEMEQGKELCSKCNKPY